jgi:hypothetical protein
MRWVCAGPVANPFPYCRCCIGPAQGPLNRTVRPLLLAASGWDLLLSSAGLGEI